MASTEESSVERRPNTSLNVDDPLVMQNSVHPGMALVTVLLADSNFLVWSRSIICALAAKNKLGLINGSVNEPTDESDRCKWECVDEMVTSWIINSMSKEIVETFVYCTFARKLWTELEEQYGEGNGPQIYHIQRQISFIEQGSQSVVMYFNRLKRLWEELNVLQPAPQCTCGVMDKCECNVSGVFSGILSQTKLIQFLMGLNNSYDAIRSQILVLDPLPSVNKAYSMVL